MKVKVLIAINMVSSSIISTDYAESKREMMGEIRISSYLVVLKNMNQSMNRLVRVGKLLCKEAA